MNSIGELSIRFVSTLARAGATAAAIAVPVFATMVVTVDDLSGAQSPSNGSEPEEARQFDFWIGEWDVNLRVRQDDYSWRDQRRSVARIYPILMGKGILELWSEDRVSGIKGYSLRYWDADRSEWVLWLNWPGPNRSGSSSLSGSFRHGRGEFFSSFTRPDGTETLIRYTFSDITPTSLRWDDAFSTDGGNSWTHSWIMEFSRTADRPTLNPGGGPEHTYHEGSRCDAPEFRRYEFLSGRREGTVEAGGRGPVTITGYEVLDGCAVMTFASADGDPEQSWGFGHITWNTSAERYELVTLTAVPGAPARVFYGEQGSDELLLYERTGDAGGAADTPGEARVDRFRIEQLDGGGLLWVHETPDGETADGWRPVWQGRLGAPGA